MSFSNTLSIQTSEDKKTQNLFARHWKMFGKFPGYAHTSIATSKYTPSFLFTVTFGIRSASQARSSFPKVIDKKGCNFWEREARRRETLLSHERQFRMESVKDTHDPDREKQALVDRIATKSDQSHPMGHSLRIIHMK